MSAPISRRLLAEGIGTLLLVATVVGSGIMAERLAGGNIAIALLGNTIPTGAILVVLITILGPVSGAQFNPVVSLALMMRGGLARSELLAHVAAQVAGGVLGTLLAHAMFGLPILALGVTPRSGTGQWLGEIAATFTLLLVIFGSIRHAPDRTAVNVGLTITAAYWFTSSTSFANPAVTIARALTPTFAGIMPGDVPMFILAQLAGMLLALGVAKILFPERIVPLDEQKSGI